jgi:hypothetical protein
MTKTDKKHSLKCKNRGYTYYNKPVRTCDTAVRVRGVSRCGKNQHRTRFKSTAGLPVPVLNPMITPRQIQHDHVTVRFLTDRLIFISRSSSSLPSCLSLVSRLVFFMVRTTQKARKSTGGTAPRKTGVVLQPAVPIPRLLVAAHQHRQVNQFDVRDFKMRC